MPPRRLPLRLQLTLWIVSLTLLTDLVLALMLVHHQSQQMHDRVREHWQARAEVLALQIQDLPHPVTPGDIAAVIARHALPGADSISVRDSAGVVIATNRAGGVTLNADGATRDGGAVRRELPGEVTTFFSGPDGHSWRLSIIGVDGLAEEALRLGGRLAIASVLIGALVTAIVSMVVSDLAVRPLTKITDLARQLSPESIDRQVQLPPAAAEVVTVQNELERARQRLEAGFAEQEQFMTNVSHEFKTPIATVLTEIHALSLQSPPQTVHEVLRSTTEELEKLSRTVDSFLILARVRHGNPRIVREPCPVREILLDSFAACAGMAAQHQVQIDLQVPEGDDLDAAVAGDHSLLCIIVDNLLRNAIRFSRPGTSIQLAGTVDACTVRLSVRDWGPGLPPELLPRLFDRFAQSSDEERHGRGTGLGLAIARGIAELHGGTITARNHESGGCEFIVELPLAKSVTA